MKSSELHGQRDASNTLAGAAIDAARQSLCLSLSTVWRQTSSAMYHRRREKTGAENDISQAPSRIARGLGYSPRVWRTESRAFVPTITEIYIEIDLPMIHRRLHRVAVYKPLKTVVGKIWCNWSLATFFPSRMVTTLRQPGSTVWRYARHRPIREVFCNDETLQIC